MTDRPILFSGPMVLGLLREAAEPGTGKTQTRRILKDQPGDLDKPFMMDDGSWHVTDSQGGHMSPLPVRFAKGDRLWVRETLKQPQNVWRYAADETPVALSGTDPRISDMIAWAHHKEGNTCVSIHMPRWASRLTLTVTDVRVQRLQEIDAIDAVAEGLLWVAPSYGVEGIADSWSADPVESYRAIWNSINGSDGWRENPWITALTFTVEQRNVDMGKER